MDRRALGFGLALVAALGLLPVPAAARERGTLVSGSLEARGPFTAAGPDGAVVGLRGGATLTLAPGTEVRLLPPTDVELAGGTTRPAHVVLLRSGAVQAEAATTADAPAVLVNVPDRLGGILLDGDMEVVSTHRATTVVSRRGSVLAGAGSRWVPLRPGHARAAVPGRSAGVERELPAEPTWTTGQRLWLTTEAAASVGDLAWTPSAAAASYRVVVQRDGDGEPLREVSTTTPRLEVPLSLPAGTYRATVTGIDDQGFAGPPSTDRGFAVVQVALPPGAYFETPHRVRLHPGQALGLRGVPGLEITYGAGEHWVAASQRLELFRDEPVLVRLRWGSDSVTPLELLPHGLSAKIAIGPRGARWPSTPATVEVRFVQHQGPEAAARITPVPRLFLGLDELPVRWEASGGRLHTTVAPRPGAGPWLLRVQVDDQYGNALGEEFFEIASDTERTSRPAW